MPVAGIAAKRADACAATATSVAPAAATAHVVQVRIKATFGSGTATFAFSGSPGWTFLKTAPTTIAAGKDAVLAITAFNDTVIAGYAAES